MILIKDFLIRIIQIQHLNLKLIPTYEMKFSEIVYIFHRFHNLFEMSAATMITTSKHYSKNFTHPIKLSQHFNTMLESQFPRL